MASTDAGSPDVTTGTVPSPERVAAVFTQLVLDLSSSALTTRALNERLANAARDLLGAAGTSILDIIEGEAFRVAAATGTMLPFDGQQFSIKPAPSLFREVLATHRSAFTNTTATDPRIDPRFHGPLALRQLAVAPILLDGEVEGLLVSINSAHGDFTAVDLEILERVAAFGALVLRSQRLVHLAEAAAADARSRAHDAARAAQRNAVLVRAARTFADATTRETLYQGLAGLLTEDMQAVGFAVYDANPRLRNLRLEYQWGAARYDAGWIVRTAWDAPLGQVILTGEPRFIENVATDPSSATIAPVLMEADVHALALIPLVLEEHVQGALAVRYRAARSFDDEERQLLGDLATQVALAFRNTVHLGELERRAERLTTVARAQQQLTQVTSEDNLPLAIAEAVQMVIPSAVCEILTATRDSTKRVLRMHDGQLVSEELIPPEDSLLARETARTGISRLAATVEDGPSGPRGTTELCAAVRFGQRSAGVIRLVAAKGATFDLQDLDLLTIIARHAGTAAETSRLFSLQDFQRQRAEGAAELARVTLLAANLAHGAQELLHVLDRFVPSIGKAIGVARARDGIIEYVATSGTLDVLLGHKPSGSYGVTGLSPEGRPVELASLRDITPADINRDVPDEWAFLVPLVARERPLGVLLVSAPRSAPLLRRDRVTLERLSSSLSLALDALLLDEEERLAREREHLLATALTTIDHPIFILDRVGVRYANPAAAREYGWTQVELMEMQFEQLVAREEPRAGMEDAAGMREPGVSLSQHVHRRRDESEFPAAVTLSPLTGHDGDRLGQVVSVRNVSQDRRLEEQLRHTEKMVALGELVAGVAHEINNPLTGISAFAQLLLEETLSDDQRESIQLIKQESDRAKSVIKDLLIFARKAERNVGPVDINALIEQTVRLRAYPLRTADVRVVLDLAPAGPLVTGDSQKLQQVLLNIFGNAEHAMESRVERQLVVRTAHDGDRVLISATDTGRGMSPDIRRRIFEPFFTTKPAGVGTGLGLSVSYGIIQAHGGTISVESEPDIGSTVTIALPALFPA